MAIISVDGHTRASRAGYRDYFDQKYLTVYDEWVADQERENLSEAGNIKPGIDVESQWDSERRLQYLETEGVVAEVLFPNALPFGTSRSDHAIAMTDPDLERQERQVYNRWLADFCAEAPGRRSGQAQISFDNIERAVEDIHWAKEHGLGGIMMPSLLPGGTAFFNPVLDPVWAACQEVGLPISQHGGAGAPLYDPPGFAAIMTLAIEQQFYCGRSLWQMVLGGVFDRHPDLQLIFVETGAEWIGPAIRDIDHRLSRDDDWMAFARLMNRERTVKGLASDYWGINLHMGISPFTVEQFEGGVDLSGDASAVITPDTVMFGVDFPHFESITFDTKNHVAGLLQVPAVDDSLARKILYENAAELYGFDLGVLGPHIERMGFDPKELLASTAA
jgi:predicted TIM-barrel fold metal-dependent hydrolase